MRSAELGRSPLQFRRNQAIAFCNDVKDLLTSACKAGKRLVQPAARLRAKAVFTRRLRELCALPAACERVEKFRKRILRTLLTLFIYFTGLPCPTTGMTRSLWSIIEGDWKSFLLFNRLTSKYLGLTSISAIILVKQRIRGERWVLPSFLAWSWLFTLALGWLLKFAIGSKYW